MLPTRSNLVVLLSAIIFAVVVRHCTAIYCWQCNSQNDRFCEDLPAGPVQNISHLEECFQKLYKECPPPKVTEDNVTTIEYTFCRKQVQTINNEKRIIRSCGFERAPTDCYFTKNPQVVTHVCQCDGDGCNGSSATSLNLLVVTASLLLLRWFY